MELQSIIQQYKPAFLEKYGKSLLPSQWQAINAMQRCRTHDSGELYVQCTQCEQSTGNPCHVVTEVAQNVRTMKLANGWIDNRKSYCLLSILWRPLPCPIN